MDYPFPGTWALMVDHGNSIVFMAEDTENCSKSN